jgi:hypothetical protein
MYNGIGVDQRHDYMELDWEWVHDTRIGKFPSRLRWASGLPLARQPHLAMKHSFRMITCICVMVMMTACGGKTTQLEGKPNIVEAMRTDTLMSQLVIPNAAPQNVVASGGGGTGPGGSVAKASRQWNLTGSGDKNATMLGVLDQLHGLDIRLDKFICAETNFAQGVKVVSDQSVDVLIAVDSQKVHVDLSTDGAYPPDRFHRTTLLEVSESCSESLRKAAQEVNAPRSTV